MANIILIEDDDKDAREMARYAKELGEDNNVRIFKTPEQFVKRYTKRPGESNLTDSESSEGFKIYSDEEVSKLDSFEYCETPAFESDLVTVVYSKADHSIKRVSQKNPGPLFGLTPDQVLEQKDFFKTFIPDPFKAHWLRILESSEETETSCFIPISSGGKIWLVYLQLKDKKNEYTIQISDYTSRAKRLIGKNINQRGGDDAKELDMLSSIDLVVFKNNLIEMDTPTWVTETRNHLRKNNYFPENGATRFIVTKYEDDGIAKSHLFHFYIDDMITLPLDRLLFLQKLQIVLSLPNKVKPKFLFLQAVDETIEISKKTKLEKINDVGLAIRNPIALRPGLSTVLYVNIPSSERPLRLTTKSSRNLPHPEIANNYLSYFDYFGIAKDSLIKIKHLLRDRADYKELKSHSEEDFEFHAENIFLTEEQKRLKNIVVLDLDDIRRKQIASSIQSNINHVSCIDESSYYIFEKKYLQTDSEESIPLREHEIYDKQIIWKIDVDSLNLVQVINAPKEGDQFCGFDATKYFKDPKDWKFFFEDENSHEQVLINLNKVQSTKEATIFVDILHSDKSPRMAKLHLRLDGDQVELCLTPPDPSDLQGDILESIDAFVMDANMIPDNFEDWRGRVEERINEKRLNPSGKHIPFITFADPDHFSENDFKNILSQDVSALIKAPVDTKTLCYHISRTLSLPFTRYNSENLGWADVRWNVYAAKSVKLIEISEFGCTIRSKKPLKVGSTIYLHGFIYENAPDENLCARVYTYELDKHEDGDYLCYLLYFGIDDSFLKYTRSWIREYYATQKAKGS